jgi:4a-hydroxytetrahydrobiopterin dehydratase
MKENHWENIGNKLTKTFHFNSYKLIIQFVNQVMEMAEEQNHHPDISVSYSKVIIIITDHEKGDVSEKCHRLKDTIDNLKTPNTIL